MPDHEFYLTHIFPEKDRIYNSLFIWENAGQRKLDSNMFYAVELIKTTK